MSFNYDGTPVNVVRQVVFVCIIILIVQKFVFFVSKKGYPAMHANIPPKAAMIGFLNYTEDSMKKGGGHYQRCCFLATVAALGAGVCLGQSTNSVERIRRAGYDDTTVVKTAKVTQNVTIQHTEHSRIFKPVDLPSIQVGGKTSKPKLAGRSPANAHLENHVETIVDFDKRRRKKTTKDLRDLHAIAVDTGASMTELSQSKAYLENDNTRVSLLQDSNIGSVADTSIFKRKSTTQSSRYNGNLFYTGIMPESALKRISQAEVTNAKLDGQDVLKITVENRFTAWVDPEQGYRYRRLERYYSDGKLQSVAEASDYRVVNHIPMPFKHRLQKFNWNEQLESTETCIVEKATLNGGLKDDDFSIDIPEGTSLTDFMRGIVIKTPEFRITLDNARELKWLLSKLTDDEPGDRWDRYVEHFILKYNLDTSQKATARSILRELKNERDQYIRQHQKDFDAMFGTKDQQEQDKRRKELNEPIEKLFQKLQSKLDRIPTSDQRRSASAQKPEPTGQKVK